MSADMHVLVVVSEVLLLICTTLEGFECFLVGPADVIERYDTRLGRFRDDAQFLFNVDKVVLLLIQDVFLHLACDAVARYVAHDERALVLFVVNFRQSSRRIFEHLVDVLLSLIGVKLNVLLRDAKASGNFFGVGCIIGCSDDVAKNFTASSQSTDN